MYIALDKLNNQDLKQVVILVPEKSIGASFYDEPLSKDGFWADWKVEPKWKPRSANLPVMSARRLPTNVILDGLSISSARGIRNRWKRWRSGFGRP